MVIVLKETATQLGRQDIHIRTFKQKEADVRKEWYDVSLLSILYSCTSVSSLESLGKFYLKGDACPSKRF